MMKSIRATALVLATVLGICVHTSARAEGGFHFPVGLTFSEGSYDAQDAILDAYEDDWDASMDTRIIIPVGLTFNPYYEWDFGLGAGLSVGPTTLAVGSLEAYDGDSIDTKFSCIIPIGADLRYTLFNKKDVAPYVRVGFRYPIVAGDNMESSTPGAFGAVGVEFWRSKTVGMGVEVGYDSSKVEIRSDAMSREVTFAGWFLSLCALF